MTDSGIDSLWRVHLGTPFPSQARGAEVEGIGLVLLDSLAAGCIASFIGNRIAPDAAKISLLGDLAQQIRIVLPHLEGESREYFAKLAEIAATVLREAGPNVTE